MIGMNHTCFDPTLADLDENHNVGAYLRAKDGDIIEGGDNDSDDVATTIESLNTRGFLYGYDATGDNWDRVKITDGAIHVLADLDVDFDFVHAEDSSHSSGHLGSYSLTVRSDTRPTNANTDADGDYASFFVNANGELYVTDVDGLAKLTEIDNVLDTIYTEQLDQGTTLDAMAVDLAAIEVELLDQGTTLDSIDSKINTCNDRIKVTDAAEGTIKTTAAAVTNTQGALVTTPLPNREFLYVQNLDKRPIYLAEAGATDAAVTGLKLFCGSIAEFRFGAAAALDAESESATADVRVMEVAC